MRPTSEQELLERIEAHVDGRTSRQRGWRTGTWQTHADRAARVIWLRYSGWTYQQIGCLLALSTSGAQNCTRRWCDRLGIQYPTGARLVAGPEPPEDPAPVRIAEPIEARTHSLPVLARTLVRLDQHNGSLYGRPAHVSRELGSVDVPRMRSILESLRDAGAVRYAESLARDGTPRWQVSQVVRL